MNHVYTVTEVTGAIKRALALGVGEVTVEGELGRFTAHRSGHWYFNVKDSGAVLNCVMFRGDNQRLGWRPAEGELVRMQGSIDVYAPQGRYSLLVRRMRPAGEGDQAQRLEALKRKLAAEGLFDPARKRPLPPLPRAIGVATSATGAAFQDILKVLRRRFPGLTVILAPCRVQGAEAPAEVARAIAALAEDGRADVIIVGRGGGSREDLAAFDDEGVARAIAACPIPVVSAVGHEVDTSVADLVADVRAATPSHAAELVVPERDQLRLLLDELDGRLRGAFERAQAARRERLARLVLRHPRQQIREARARTVELGQRLRAAGQRDLERHRARLAGTSGRLHALSPVAVLSRGYAVVLKDGHAVRRDDELASGDPVVLRLHQGQVGATVD